MNLSNNLPNLLEAGMLVCFGLSWPISILKSLRTKYVRGKSPCFMLIILLGYLVGIQSKLVEISMLGKEFDPVTWLYLTNITLILTDLSVYFLYRQNHEQLLPEKVTSRKANLDK